MTVKEYAIKHEVSKQSVYDRINRGTLQVEIIEGVKHVIESSSQVKPLKSLVSNIDQKCSKSLEKALKKGLKSKHKLDLAMVQLNSMDILLKSKDNEIASLKKSLDFLDVVVSKKLLLMDKDHDVIDVEPTKKKKHKKK